MLNSDTVMTNVTGLSFLNVEMHARLWDALLSQNWDQGPHVLISHSSRFRRECWPIGSTTRTSTHSPWRSSTASSTTPARTPARPPPVRDPFVSNLQRAGSSAPRRAVGDRPQRLGQVARRPRMARTPKGMAVPLVLDARRSRESGLVAARGDGDARRRGRRRAAASGRHRREPDQCGQGRADSLARPLELPDQRPGEPPARLVFTADLSRCSEAVLRHAVAGRGWRRRPALASRSRDIPSIAGTLLAEIEPRRRPVLSAATMQVLMRWDWPGNVAELRQVLLGLAAELPGQSVSPYHLPERMWDAANRRPLTRIESAERTEILAALRQSDGNRSKAASLLGIGRTTLYRKLHALGIDDETPRCTLNALGAPRVTQLPRNAAGRFSRNAAVPSCLSAVV